MSQKVSQKEDTPVEHDLKFDLWTDELMANRFVGSRCKHRATKSFKLDENEIATNLEDLGRLEESNEGLTSTMLLSVDWIGITFS